MLESCLCRPLEGVDCFLAFKTLLVGVFALLVSQPNVPLAGVFLLPQAPNVLLEKLLLRGLVEVVVGFVTVFDFDFPINFVCFGTGGLFLLFETEVAELVVIPEAAPEDFLAGGTFCEFCLEVEEIPSDFDGL